MRPLDPPAILTGELPLTEEAATTVVRGREEVERIVSGDDGRLLVVVGPCSVHDPDAALEYADRLAETAADVADDLLVVMRVYFEKPRTTVGWKGLINDPGLDGSFDVARGLRTARRLLLDIADRGLPAGCEFLDPITPQYLADAVSWGAIGARTAASQVHRNLASGLSMPIGIKNSTEGSVQLAVDGVRAAGASHVFPGVTEDGSPAILTTAGNPDCHVILRGGQAGTNYDAASVATARGLLADAGLPERLVVDASHGNSGKDYRRQPVVAADVAEQLRSGEPGVIGVMLESFLTEGSQSLESGSADRLAYGQSITDGCLGWDSTVSVLRDLAAAVAARRAISDRVPA